MESGNSEIMLDWLWDLQVNSIHRIEDPNTEQAFSKSCGRAQLWVRPSYPHKRAQ